MSLLCLKRGHNRIDWDLTSRYYTSSNEFNWTVHLLLWSVVTLLLSSHHDDNVYVIMCLSTKYFKDVKHHVVLHFQSQRLCFKPFTHRYHDCSDWV